MKTLPYSIVFHSTGKSEGWQAMTLGPVPTCHTIGLRSTPEEVVALVQRMQSVGFLDAARSIEVVR